MPVGRADFVRALAGERITVPDGAFGPVPAAARDWKEDADLRRAFDWFVSYLGPGEWQERRYAAWIRLYCAAYHLPVDAGEGRYFDATDTFGWYLFLAEACLDHPWNYEPMFGSRVIPLFCAIGRSLDLLKAASGVEARIKRLIGPERRQPNGGIFELLVAAAYLRDGGVVSFRLEEPGITKSHDLDVEIGGRAYAVECKRMETSAYGDRERNLMRNLWEPAASYLEQAKRSTFAKVDFLVPVMDVPASYLFDRIRDWVTSDRPSLLWNDRIAQGIVGDLDLEPLNKATADGDVLSAGTRLLELLSGRYRRHVNYIQALFARQGDSPRYIKDCKFAVLLQWQSIAQEAVKAKARDVLKKLAEANDQLPEETPSIVHIGFEAVEGDEVEIARYEKIRESTGNFDPKGKVLRYVYCHYFVPESPPLESWAFEETVFWRKISGSDPLPLATGYLVMPPDIQGRSGTHWSPVADQP